MKILVITGSPRKNGNSNAMVSAFIEQAQSNGHHVDRFDAAFLRLEGCRACMKCFTGGKACIFDDDFNTIAPYIEEADVIIYAMPLYWYSIPAQIKNIIDKIFSFYVAKKNISEKKFGLICCCEEKDVSLLSGIVNPMKLTVNLLKWEWIGEVLIPGVFEEKDIEKTDGCSQARLLAEKL